MPKKPQVLARRIEARSQLFAIESLDLRFQNGEQRRYERLLGGSMPAVLVVPVLNDGRIMLIREYGAGVDDYELALPKGRVEAGEDMLEAANRELMEEIGFSAAKLVSLKVLSQSPGYMQHKTEVVLAQQLTEATAEGDEPEPIECVPVHRKDIHNLILNDNLSEARSIAALYLAFAYLDNQAS